MSTTIEAPPKPPQSLPRRPSRDAEPFIRRSNNGTDVAFPLTKSVGGGGFNITNLGTLNIGNGSITAPSIGFETDTNTGLYRVSADVLGATAGGVDVMRFNTATTGVNYLDGYAAATTARPRIAVAGSDSNISGALRSKGTGEWVQEDGSGNNVGWAPRSYISGLTMSTAGSSTTMTVAAGMARDSTNVKNLVLASAIAKTTVAWAVGTGNGGLDTGTIANSTGYFFWLILRSDTGVVDVVFSTSATAPTMPTSYDYRRRIGWGRTDGSGNWTSFTQDGDYFRWAASILDIDVTNPGTSAVSRTLTVPSGVNVYAIFDLAINATLSSRCYVSDLAATDEAPSATAAPLFSMGFATGTQANSMHIIRTNTSAQIRSRFAESDGSTTFKIATLGWIDRRGRDS